MQQTRISSTRLSPLDFSFLSSLLTFSYFNDSTVVHCGTLWPNLVGALDPGLRGLGPRPGQFIVLCSWTKHFTLSASLQPGV